MQRRSNGNHMKQLYIIGRAIFLPFKIINNIGHKLYNAESWKDGIELLLMLMVFVIMLYSWWKNKGMLSFIMCTFGAFFISGMLYVIVDIVWAITTGFLLFISEKPSSWYCKLDEKIKQPVDLQFFIEKEKKLKIYNAKYFRN